MPSHIPPAYNDPPSMWDRATAHSVEVLVLVYGVFEAVKIPILAATVGRPATSSIALLPTWLVLTLITFVGVGSTLALTGILVRRHDLRREINTEQSGWALLGIGWLGYGVGSDILNPGVAVASDLGYALAAAALWRYVALRRIERALDEAKATIDAVTGALPIVPPPREAGA